MVFSDDASVISPFSGNLEEAETSIRRVIGLRFAGRTYLRDAVREASHRFIWFDDKSDQRRAVLVVTDNFGTPGSRRGSVIESLWEADAVLSGLIVRNHTAIAGVLGLPSLSGVEDLVEKTGGDFIRSDDLRSKFPEMMHRLRSRYTLYYKLPEGQVGSLRKIDVRLSETGSRRFPNAHVLARRGYRLRPRDQFGFTSP